MSNVSLAPVANVEEKSCGSEKEKPSEDSAAAPCASAGDQDQLHF